MLTERCVEHEVFRLLGISIANSGNVFIVDKGVKFCMSEITDRLLILLIVAVALGGILVGWLGGFIVPALGGWSDQVGMAVIAVFFVAILIGVWFEFDRIGTDRD